MQLFKHQQDIIDADPNEIWKDVIGYEGLYQVSNFGRVLGVKRKKILTPRDVGNKYMSVVLSKNDVMKNKKVYRLAAQAFIPNPENKLCINHIDNKPENNNLNNLEWCTYKENREHCMKQNRHNWGEKNGHSKLVISDIKYIRKSSLSTKELSVKYNVTMRTIRDIVTFDTWRYL